MFENTYVGLISVNGDIEEVIVRAHNADIAWKKVQLAADTLYEKPNKVVTVEITPAGYYTI